MLWRGSAYAVRVMAWWMERKAEAIPAFCFVLGTGFVLCAWEQVKRGTPVQVMLSFPER